MKADDPGRHRRVVVDTNIWISAALSRTGAPAMLVRRVLADRLPVFTPATFVELEARLWRPKFDRYLDMALRKRILHDLSAAACWVQVPTPIAERTWCRDAGDDKFIHAALAAHAPWLVTGDRDLLELPTMQDLCVFTARAALDSLVFWGESTP